MSLLSLKQFQELINTAIEYQPHRDRFDGQHPSAEIFTGAGNIVNSIRLKFYIQDDGGTWDWTEIAKPQFIWDMKKVMASSVIDDGMANRNANLATYSVNETDDGIQFYESTGSKLFHSASILNDGLNFTKTVLNCWFRPSQNNNYSEGVLFKMDSDSQEKLSVSIGTDQTNSERFYIRIYSQLTNTINFDHIVYGTVAMPLEWEKKYNLVLSLQDLSLKIIVNGHTFINMPIPNVLTITKPVGFMVGFIYKGEISYMSLNCYYDLDDTYLEAFWKFGYPLPRGPELVDLSDYFEQHGRNLLIEVGDIDKAIENIKGQLYVKTNSVKLRDL